MPSGITQQLFGVGTALLAGYLFVRLSHFLRFRAEHLRADRYALHVLGYSLALYPLGALAANLVTKWRWTYLADVASMTNLPHPTVYAIALAIPAACLFNLVVLIRMSDDPALIPASTIRYRMRIAAVALYVKKTHDYGIRTLYRATVLQKRLMVTLSTGKVYVGEPVGQLLEDPSTVAGFIRLVPFASGYRHHKTKRVTLSTWYASLSGRLAEPVDEQVLAKRVGNSVDPLQVDPAMLSLSETEVCEVDLADLGVSIQWTEIESMTIFDENIYRAFNVEEKSSGAVESTPQEQP